MHYWRGVVTHAAILLAQPAYLAVQYVLGHPRSPLNLTIHVGVWVYVVTRISIPFFTSPLRQLPSPPGEKWLIGHLNFNGGRPPTKVFEDMINGTPNDGLIAIWLPLYLRCEIIPTRPDTLMDLLNSHGYDWEKPSLQKRVLAGMLGQGLATVEGAEHKAMRRVLTPAFSGRVIRDQAPLFYTKGIGLTDVMTRQVKETGEGVLEMGSLLSRVSLDIIGAAGVGMEFNTVENEDSPLPKLYYSVVRPPAFFMLINLFFPQWLLRQLRWTGVARNLEAQSQLRKELNILLQEKKEQMKHEESAHDSKDIIASIMKAGDFSDDYLFSQLLTTISAGHDTTASALTWATWLLASHPDIQDRLRAECIAQLADIPTSEVDASNFDTDKMPFLSAVCNESLRLYPPAPGTSRNSVVPTTIGKYHIPQGTPAVITAWAINRSRDLWGADAAEFKPDRWLEGPHAANGGAETPHAFITFLHGPRSCIGQAFARLEMKCLLAALFTRFRFEIADPDQKVEVGGFIIIKPEAGMRLKVFDLKQKDS
ncbi:hypothetical protein H2200_007992 [Cladophialophora chaetospira]|uniref:Cytochrome P450 n=1 Tax=Cladophialophora chaetospira TaxID=386627 RepID=A0AA38X7B1_9EURO|nr:hypothetical protein H2200_007992 [Cladophialophora chaetospira]